MNSLLVNVESASLRQTSSTVVVLKHGGRLHEARFSRTLQPGPVDKKESGTFYKDLGLLYQQCMLPLGSAPSVLQLGTS